MGHGSSASPSVWLSIVVVLLTALTILAPIAMPFIDPWGDIFEVRNANSFVMPFKELIAQGQACAQIWE